MPTAFAALSQALAARLLEAPQITGDRVFRDRVAPLPREFDNAIVVRQVNTAGSRAGAGLLSPIDWSTDFEIEITAKAAADEVATDAVDPLLAAVFERLAGWQPDDLSVVEVVPDPRIDWDRAEGHASMVCARIALRIVHRTEASSLTAWG